MNHSHGSESEEISHSHEHRPHKQEQEAASEEVSEVGPNIIRTQLPVNLLWLGHVNCYLIEDKSGIAVVDPGLLGRRLWKALSNRLKTAGYRMNDIHTVIVTHSHFDHFGGAERIRTETGAKFLRIKTFAKHSIKRKLRKMRILMR